MPKICFFSGDITRSGGTERVATMIANGLLRYKEFEILFLSLVEQQDHLFFPLDDAIPHFALGQKWISPGPGYLKVLPKLHRFLKRQKVDIIIDIDIALDVLSVPAAKGLSVKVIAWEHSNYSFETSVFYRNQILRHATKRADYIVTLTNQDAHAFQKGLQRKERICAIYNPMESVLDDRKEGRKENSLITVGRLIHVKGMDYLATVAKKILPLHPDWKWYVIGDGEQRELLERAISRYHLQGQLILTGRLQEVGPYLEKSKIYVMTSRSEGLPMCLLEAKSHSLPIVSFDIATGPGEIVEHGKNGYLVPAFDCKAMVERLHQLMTDGGTLRRFSKHALDNIGRFQMEHILDDWHRLLTLCQ